MSSLRDFIHLAVPEYIPMGLTALLVGLVSSTHFLSDGWRLFFALVSVTFLIAGYNSFNAIVDVSIDAVNRPERPLPSKRVTKPEAFWVSVFEFAISLVAGILVGEVFFVFSILSVIIAVAYSLPGVNLKARFGWGTLSAAVLYVLFFPFEGWAMNPGLPVPVWTFALLFFYGIGTAVLKDFGDYRGDASFKAETLPVKLGYREASIFVASSYVFTLLLLFFVVGQGLLPIRYLVTGVFPVIGLFNAYRLYSSKLKETARQTFIYGLGLLIFYELTLSILALA